MQDERKYIFLKEIKVQEKKYRYPEPCLATKVGAQTWFWDSRQAKEKGSISEWLTLLMKIKHKSSSGKSTYPLYFDSSLFVNGLYVILLISLKSLEEF